MSVGGAPVRTALGLIVVAAAVPLVAAAGGARVDTVSAAPRPPDGSFTLVATGDMMPHRSLLRRLQRENGSLAIDGAFTDVAGLIRGADLAICHVEGALLAPGEDLRPSHILGTPPVWLAEVKRAGYDRCSTASNHSLDGAAAGVDATVAGFAAAGLGQSGVAASAATRLPEMIDVNGVRVAHLSYTYGLDHGRLPPGEPWRANLIDPQRIIDDATQMRGRGAEAVILSLHWGRTQWVEPSPEQLSLAEQVTRSGQIDLIIGSHTHLIQPISKVNGVWVVWGMGNILSNHPVNPKWTPATQDGVIIRVPFRRADGRIVVGAPQAYPTWCDKDNGYRIRFAAPKHRRVDLPAGTVRSLKVSYARTKRILGDHLAASGQ